MNNSRHTFLLAAALVALASCSSIDSSTSKALDLCEQIEDERLRVDCITTVNEQDPDR